MSQKPPDGDFFQGMQVAPPGPGSWLTGWRGFICDIINMVMNPRIFVPVDPGNGTSPIQLDARIIMSRNGWCAILPAVAAPGTGTGTGTGGGGISTYNNTLSYGVGAIVSVESAGPYSGTSATLGIFFAVLAVPPAGTANQIPQYPLPPGAVYWKLISLAPVLKDVCNDGVAGQMYIQGLDI